MAAEQPDFQRMGQLLGSIADQVALIPNMPAVVGFENVHEQALALQQQAEQHQQTLDQVILRVDTLQESVERLPMRLFNAIASREAPLQYPPGVPSDAQLPMSKQDILGLSVAGAQNVSQALGLPALPPHDSIAQHQQQILDFLGCALRA